MADDPENMEDLGEEQEQQEQNLGDKAFDTAEKGKDLADKFSSSKKPDVPKSTASSTGVSSAGASSGATGGVAGAGGAGATGGAASGAAGGAAGAAGTSSAAGATSAAAGSGASIVGVAGAILGIVVAIILLVGIIIVLIYLPGSLIEGIKGFFRGIKEFFAGEDAALGNEDFAQVANYIRDRGYDLYAEGYVNDQFNPDTDFNDLGKIQKLPEQRDKSLPHLVELYTRMDKYTYRVRNNDIRKVFNTNQDMSGFLYFLVGDWDENKLISEEELSKGFFRKRINVTEDRNLLTVKRKLFGGTYNFYMDGWAGRYGLPLELFMALHQGTRAPDLVREIAKGTETYRYKIFDNVFNNWSYKDQVLEYDEDLIKHLVYKKPILNILLLETEYQSTINFVIPSNTNINGQVYVLNRELNFDEEYDEYPFNFTDSDFTQKSEVSAGELYKTFFKTPDGRYIRIKPKKPNNSARLGYQKSVYARNLNGAFRFVEPVEKIVENISKEKDPETGEIIKETVTKYKIKEENYDLSEFYFEQREGKYFVKDLRDYVIGGKNLEKELKFDKTVDPYTPEKYRNVIISNSMCKFIDKYGLYNVIQELREINPQIKYYGNFIGNMLEIVEDTKGSTYLPLIKNSESHWFRDIYFYLLPNQEYIEEDEDYFLLTNEHWAKYDITEEEGKKILTPKTLSEAKAWNAYEIKTSKHADGIGVPISTDDAKFIGFSNFVYLHEGLTSSARQIEEGRRGMTNPRTKNLFTDVKWYKYDGTVERADINNEDRLKEKESRNLDLKSYIEPDTDLLAAFEILEGSKSLDAQYILRDLKELYVELGYYDKEDLRDPVRRILRWPLATYRTPRMWPAADIHQDSEGYGVYIPSKSTLEKVYNEETLKNNKDVIGEGFEPGIDVVSPVTGRIEEIGTTTVNRTVNDKDGNFIKIESKEVGYITISAIDEKAPKETEQYKDFYDYEYKQVISGKIKHGVQSEESRYLEGNKIIIAGIDVDIPDNVNDKENSRYIRQLKSSAIRRVQDKKTREEAEAIEQRKINAPNYISIAGSELHIGDYIKEGTIIGKTTESDVRISMKDSDKAFVENVDHYFVKDLGFYIQIMDDYYTKAEEGEPNVLKDKEMFEYIFDDFSFLRDNAQAFLDMQEKYGVNAIFAACVTIQECNGGNDLSGVHGYIQETYGGDYNNIFSIQGKATDPYYEVDGPDGKVYWNIYPDVASSCEAFAICITQSDGFHWRAGNYYVNEIAPSYCGASWGIAVNSIMTRMLTRAQERYTGMYNMPLPMGSEMFKKIYKEAISLLGCPYSKDGHMGQYVNGKQYFDCSGLVLYVYGKKFGLINFSRRSCQEMFNSADLGETIFNYEDGRPGDIIFFYDNEEKKIDHVGIYIGNNQMIDATGTNNLGVSIRNIDGSYFRPRFYGFKRVRGVN